MMVVIILIVPEIIFLIFAREWIFSFFRFRFSSVPAQLHTPDQNFPEIKTTNNNTVQRCTAIDPMFECLLLSKYIYRLQNTEYLELVIDSLTLIHSRQF
jgi:hypothetical protein